MVWSMGALSRRTVAVPRNQAQMTAARPRLLRPSPCQVNRYKCAGGSSFYGPDYGLTSNPYAAALSWLPVPAGHVFRTRLRLAELFPNVPLAVVARRVQSTPLAALVDAMQNPTGGLHDSQCHCKEKINWFRTKGHLPQLYCPTPWSPLSDTPRRLPRWWPGAQQ